MTSLERISKTLWRYDQYLKDSCPNLLKFANRYAPLWCDIFADAYCGDHVEELYTEDGMKVRMVPYRLWELRYQPDIDFRRSIFLLCSLGLLGIDEEDFCKRKEWIFYTINDDFDMIKWYAKIVNSGATRCKSRISTFDWIKENLKDGCTYHSMVCGNGRDDRITLGVPGELAGTI